MHSAHLLLNVLYAGFIAFEHLLSNLTIWPEKALLCPGD